MADIKSIYDLRLHEKLNLDKYTFVLRVPGGWIYQTSEPRYEWDNMAVFVPFNKEFFQKKEINHDKT